MPRNTRVLVKILLDIIFLLVVGIPILIYHLHGKPFKRGFFCDDDSIRYPFKTSTITNNVLYVVGIFLPILVIVLNEFVNESMLKREDRGHVYELLGRSVPHVVWNIYKKIGVFLFGACMSQLTTDIAKYTIGRLRPHFLYLCQPSFNCSLAIDKHIYIDFAECLGPDKAAIREARLSFPSGHSSFSAYTMVYATIYLHACMNWKGNKLLKPLLQFIFIMMSWYTCLSRISDFKHHWSDVLIGFLQGTIVSIITAYYVSDFFPMRRKSRENSLQAIAIDPAATTAANYNTMKLSDVDPR